MSNPDARGSNAEAQALAALVRAGKRVLIPWGNQRYDLALDQDGSLSWIQVKSGWLKRGAICFNTASLAYHIGAGAHTYVGEIDAFAVYCPQTGKVYLVPIQDVPVGRQASLRVEQAANGQAQGMRWAKDYEIG